jgi:regulator of sigma E protease
MAAIALVYVLVRYLGIVGNVITVMLGFGAVVLVHEFGHFIVAKLSGIKVEAFSMFMPPTLIGLQRTEAGIRLRFFPAFSSKEGTPEPEGKALVFGKPGKAGDTEYRLGLIPFGGYVKLLGQEDVGPVRQNDDPHSYANKPVRVRIPVIAAGVTFNAISAAIIFMVVFLIGIQLQPAVVGDVEPNSPAAKAGLKTGDEIVEIDGRSADLDFSNIQLSAALSGRNESVPMTVRHRDGSEERISMIADQPADSPIKRFGVGQPFGLTIGNMTESDAALVKQQMGLEPGDQVVAVDGKPVEHYWQYADLAKQVLALTIPITVKRGTEQVQVELPREVGPAVGLSETELRNAYSMVPRLQIAEVNPPQPSLVKRFLRSLWLRLSGSSGKEEDATGVAQLQHGDVILAIGDIENPTYEELRKLTSESKDKPLAIKVLRTDPNGAERSLALIVTPRLDSRVSKRVVIGFAPVLDLAHAVVADTVAVPGGAKLDIPRGARITAVNGRAVANYYDILREVRRADAQPVTLEYRQDGNIEGGVTLQPSLAQMPIRFDSQAAVPFKLLERSYRADGVVQALTMGYHRTVMFIAQSYVTLQRLLSRVLSPKLLMGPVGIMVASYQIVAAQSTVYYFYFLGLISASIAVLNLLPIPPFDGGLIVLMLIEKVKGSALSEKTQGILAYTGWLLVLALLLYVTFNDLVRTLGLGS